jgi:YD repeat-containing protein
MRCWRWLALCFVGWVAVVGFSAAQSLGDVLDPGLAGVPGLTSGSLASTAEPAGQASSSGSPAESSVGGFVGPGGPVASSVPSAEVKAPPPPLSEGQVLADRASRTAYAGLGGSEAVGLAERTFHVEAPVWTAPGSRAGTRVSRYDGEFGAVEEHSGGGPVLVASTVPLRVADRSGQLSPVSLTLGEEGGVLAPHNPLVPVSISKAASGGVSLPEGVTVTAAGASGSQATIAGDHAVWTNSAVDTDLMVEPLPLGVEFAWQLRSQASPDSNALVFRLASGESLQMSSTSPGSVEVARGGETLLVIAPSSARQANGEPLSVSYALSGDVLSTRVNLEGNVDFPVLVDPKIVVGHYGQESKGWQQREERASWHSAQNCSCFGFGPFRGTGESIWRSGSPYISNSWGQWYINPDNASEVQITRVDLTGVTNTRSANWAEAGIYESGTFNGNGKGVYSYNGVAGATGPSPMWYNGENGGANEGKAVAFCAVGAGGNDGGSQPLCNENEGGEGFAFGMYKESSGGTSEGTVGAETAQVRFIQSTHPTVKLEYLRNGWFDSQTEGTVYVSGEDHGTGVAELAVDAVPGTQSEVEGSGSATPEPWGSHLLPGITPYTTECPNAFCWEKVPNIPFSLKGLGTGIWDVGGWDRNAVGYEHEESHVALIDNTPPEIQTPSWVGTTLGDAAHELSFSAQDGSTSAPQSGVDRIWLEVDGRTVYNKVAEEAGCPKPEHKVPSASCFGLSGSYTLASEGLAAGEHTITLHAKDWVGNVSEKTANVNVVHATGQTQQVGPGTLNLQSGDYKLSASDASVSAGGGADLTVSRTYDSQSTASGSLGEGWTLSTPDSSAAGQWESLEALANGNVEAATTSGRKALFTAAEGRFSSPTGYQTYTLTEIQTSPAVYRITDSAGNYSQFEKPSGASSFLPTKVAQAASTGGLNSVTYVLAEGRTSEIVGPEPAGVSCGEKPLEREGCRTLVLHYATATTASGEAASEWGEYKGQLGSISFTAWDPAKSEMTTSTVAQYTYDSRGRLRAEWDPRISPALKTTYAYDSEGHLTALASPGVQPYLFHYGTVATGTGDGWLLSVSRPGAATALGNGAAPVSTGVPKLSSVSPVVGTTLNVSSNGKWSNTPLAYFYQWEHCNSTGGECAEIPAATNQTYTPQKSDAGHSLVAEVTAESGAGAGIAVTAASGVVPAGESTNNPVPPAPKPGTTAVTSIEYHVPVSGTGAPHAMGSSEVAAWGQTDAPAEATAIFPPDEPQGWPAGEYERANVYYFDGFQRRVNVASPGGTISTTMYDGYDNVDWSLTPGNRQTAVGAGEASKATAEKLATISTYTAAGTELERNVGPQHEVKLANGELVKARAFTRHFYDEGAPSSGGPYRLMTKTVEGAQVESGLESGKEADTHTITDSYSGQENLGWALHKPTGVTVETAPGKTSTRVTTYEATTGDVATTSTPAGSAKESPILLYTSAFGNAGAEAGQLNGASAVTVDSSSRVWVADTKNNRVEAFSATGTFELTLGWGVSDGKEAAEACTSACKAGIAGSGAGEFQAPQGIAYDRSNGNIYVSDTANNRIEAFNTKGGFVKAFGWGVHDGKEELETCTTSCKAGNAGSGHGQLSSPAGLNIDSSGNLWVADSANSRIQEFSAEGAYLNAYGKHGAGNDEFSAVNDVTLCNGNLYAVDSANRVQELSTEGKYITQFGAVGNETGHFTKIARIACNAKNNDLYVTDEGSSRIQVFTSSGTPVGSFGSEGKEPGQLSTPVGIAISESGSAYISDSANSRISVWSPGNPAAHTSLIVYYSAAANPSYPVCGGHPEWANLPCESRPAAQPATLGLPELPVTTTTYNIFDQAVSVTRTSGSQTRTATTSYDAAGRTQTSTVTSTTGKALPTVSNTYDEKTGALVKQSTTSEGHTQTITSGYNSLGQLTSYTDATGNISTSSYDIDGRLVETFDGKGTRTYTYDAVTGNLRTLKDSAAGTFSATYDIEGHLLLYTYPSAMKAAYTYNSTGQPTSLIYTKGIAKWYTDTVVPSIRGQWMTQQSTLARETYTYDNLSRLSEVSETPVGKGCTTHLYTYDEDSNRTSETTRESGSATCTTSGGSSVSHAYDSADRLNDPGTQYQAFGADTSLPAADVGGHTLDSSYYASGALYTQTQNAQTNSYTLDPVGRVTEATTATGLGTKSRTNHYSGASSTAAWSEEQGTTNTTRNIVGINSALVAIQTNSETPVIQIANLHGDIIGTAPDSTEAKTATLTSEPTAFGVPTTTTSSKNGWLGSSGLETEFETGITASSTGAYIPQLGLRLEPEALSASALQDPTNEYLANRGYAPPNAGYNGESPNSINPLPVNTQIEKEFWEHPTWAPAPGNQESIATLSTGFEVGGEGATAAKGFYHEIEVSPWVAGELGTAIFWTHHLGGLAGGWFHVPGWLIQCVDAAVEGKLVGGLDQLAANLQAAGAFASGPVKITAFGSLTSAYWVDVEFAVKLGVDYPAA